MLIKLALHVLALWGVGYFVAGVSVANIYSAFLVVLVLGLFSFTIKPLLLLFTLPINMVTLGFFTLVINASLFWLTATMVKGFTVQGFWPAFLGALFYSVASVAINTISK